MAKASVSSCRPVKGLSESPLMSERVVQGFYLFIFVCFYGDFTIGKGAIIHKGVVFVCFYRELISAKGHNNP